MQTARQRPLPDQDITTQTLRLAPGQTMLVWLPAGSLIVCNAPAASIAEPPYWQANQLRIRRTELSDGQSMRFEQAGWADIVARQGGEVLCLRPELHAWRRAWGKLLRLLPSRLGVTPARR
ncbi:hypothetical protein Herbaro_14440 [Herbaspirillum sp. WKF16]|jgi:hypothetical protein|uniref:hypothetical protein n=1 Tax=Herbaspirillum sp. WKF16 TaxID=3028312 RepID=UPI0023A93D97|nr:hypothetical protein [Herbaspirillum sp. WKF16]WDZ94683.1 hypothetical protein Herbaro_14440 [Herbaspirillum sp. WKF16]